MAADIAKNYALRMRRDRVSAMLRREAAAKANAVQPSETAPAARRVDPRRVDPLPRYAEWSKEDLVRRARELGIADRPDMTKAELIAALRNR